MRRPWPALALAAAAYVPLLAFKELFHDDSAIISGSFLLHDGWRGLWGLATTGYWEAVQGPAATVHYYRPFLLLSFWLQVMTTGDWTPALRLANLGLHVGVVLLLWDRWRARLTAEAAAAAAAFYAAAPVHVESVAAVTGRSEVLVALLLLGAWRLLEGAPSLGRRTVGVALYGLALLTKETAFLFPALLALADWVFDGTPFWRPGRRRLYAALLLVAAAVWTVRAAVLPEAVSGGVPYFSSKLTAALTFGRFAAGHYLIPALTGLGQCSDYSRPLIPDAGLGEWSAWLAAAGWGALAVLGLLGVWRRRVWGFSIVASLALLLPTSHLLLPLDSIGAERFLYLPLAGLAAGIGLLYERAAQRAPAAARALGAAALLWLAGRTAAQAWTYRSRESFYRAAVSCNPVSARAWSSLGGTYLTDGRVAEGLPLVIKAMELDPKLCTPRFNLARLDFERGRWTEAEARLRAVFELAPLDVNACVLGALVAERLGQPVLMRQRLEKALDLVPGHPLALYNLGRYWLLVGRPAQARRAFALYLDRVPRDREVSSLLRSLPQKE
jgi:protein O-mannosyl-transferase